MAEFREATLLASGARSTTQTLDPASISGASSARELSLGGDAKILEVYVNLTAFSTAASLTLSIEKFDEIANAWVSILAATALTATGTKTLLVGPELVTAANAVLANMVPQRWRVVATHGNANSYTYHVVARVIR